MLKKPQKLASKHLPRMAEMGMVINSGTTAIPGIDKRCYRKKRKKTI